MLAVAKSCDKVLSDPEPVAVMMECAENGVKYVLRVWCNGTDYWSVREYVIAGVRNAFKDADITIPYPHMNVSINNK